MLEAPAAKHRVGGREQVALRRTRSISLSARIVWRSGFRRRSRLAIRRVSGSAGRAASTSSTIWSASAAPVQARDHRAVGWRRGAKMPVGVADQDQLRPPTIAMPSSRLRVVCTFGVTIASFCPTSWLSSVDLPALGAPIKRRPIRSGHPPPAEPREEPGYAFAASFNRSSSMVAAAVSAAFRGRDGAFLASSCARRTGTATVKCGA